jgi:hypothetical protein
VLKHIGKKSSNFSLNNRQFSFLKIIIKRWSADIIDFTNFSNRVLLLIVHFYHPPAPKHEYLAIYKSMIIPRTQARNVKQPHGSIEEIITDRADKLRA